MMKSKPYRRDSRPDWEQVQVKVEVKVNTMRIVLEGKTRAYLDRIQ